MVGNNEYEFHQIFKANLWSRSRQDSILFCTKWGGWTGAAASGTAAAVILAPSGPGVIFGTGMSGLCGYIGGALVGAFFGVLGILPTYLINRYTQSSNFFNQTEVDRRLPVLARWATADYAALQAVLEEVVTEYHNIGFNFNASQESHRLIRQLGKVSHLHHKLELIKQYMTAECKGVPLNQGKKLFRIIMEKLEQYSSLSGSEMVQVAPYKCPIGGENLCFQDPIKIKAKLAREPFTETEIIVDRRNLFIAQHQDYDRVPTFTYRNQTYLVPLPKHMNFSPCQYLHQQYPDLVLHVNQYKKDIHEAYGYQTEQRVLQEMQVAGYLRIKPSYKQSTMKKLKQSFQWVRNSVYALFNRSVSRSDCIELDRLPLFS